MWVIFGHFRVPGLAPVEGQVLAAREQRVLLALDELALLAAQPEKAAGEAGKQER